MVTLGCIYMYRFMDTAVCMKEAVTDDLIGQLWLAERKGLFFRDQPYYDSDAWRGKWETEGGGSLVTRTSHTLDLIRRSPESEVQKLGSQRARVLHRLLLR